MKKTSKKKPTPARRKKPVSRLADRRKAPAGAVAAGPVSWTPPSYLPHQRVKVVWPDRPRGEYYPDDWISSYSEKIGMLRRSGHRMLAIGHEEGVMVAHFGPAVGNA